MVIKFQPKRYKQKIRVYTWLQSNRWFIQQCSGVLSGPINLSLSYVFSFKTWYTCDLCDIFISNLSLQKQNNWGLSRNHFEQETFYSFHEDSHDISDLSAKEEVNLSDMSGSAFYLSKNLFWQIVVHPISKIVAKSPACSTTCTGLEGTASALSFLWRSASSLSLLPMVRLTHIHPKKFHHPQKKLVHGWKLSPKDLDNIKIIGCQKNIL